MIKDTKFKEGDVVLAKSCAGDAIPVVKIKLIKKIVVPEIKGNNFNWPGYIHWKANLICEKEVKMLKKRFQIPYSYPDDVETYVFDSDIVKKYKINKKSGRPRRRVTYAQQDLIKSRKS